MRERSRDELVIIAATLIGSKTTEDLVEVDDARADELVRQAADGGLWVVKGARFARVIPAFELLAKTPDYLPERDAPLLFDGGPPRAMTRDGRDPVDLMVPVAGWDAGRSFYFHSDAAYFKAVPVVRKHNHRLGIERGLINDRVRKMARRHVIDGQRCGVLGNELGGCCIVQDGEVAPDLRAMYAERFRFIIDGLRDLSAAADALEGYAAQFRDAADVGWVLERPIENSFVYAVNRRRLRTLLPLPAPGALVPVDVAAIDDDLPVGESEEPDLVHEGSARDEIEEIEEVSVNEETEAPVGALVGAVSGAPLVPANPGPGRVGTGMKPASVPALSVSAELLAHQPLALGSGPPARSKTESLIEHFVTELLATAPDLTGAAGRRDRGQAGMAVLRASTFRRPRGRLMRVDTPSRMVKAVVFISDANVELLHGALTTEITELLETTIEEDETLAGIFGVCRGAFGYVLAEVGSPMRAIQSMSSSTSYAHLLDGVARLDEAAARLHRVAADLQRLADEGWTLTQPIAGFWLRLSPPLRQQA